MVIENSELAPPPADYVLTLQALMEELPGKQRRLGEALLRRPETFALGTLATLESALGISRMTIIRFAKALGFSGYGALQDAVRGQYLQHLGFTSPEGARSAPPSDLVERTVERQLRSLESVTSKIELSQFRSICELLGSASRIVVTGVGSASIVAQLLVRLLRHVGLNGELLTPTSVDAVITMSGASRDTVFVGFSLWLTFEQTMKLMHIAKARGVPTVAITGSDASPLRTMADYSLVAPAQGHVPRFSLVAPIALVELIVAEIASHRLERAADIEEKIYDQYIEENLLAPL